MCDEEEEKASFRIDGFSSHYQYNEVGGGMGGQLRGGMDLKFGGTSAVKFPKTQI